MVREDHSVHLLNLPGAASAGGLAEIGVGERLGDLQRWTRRVLPSADGSLLYLGGDQGQLMAIDARSGEVRQRYAGDADAVYALALSPDGRWLLSGDTGGRVRVWDAATGEKRGESTDQARLVRDLAVAGDDVLVASDDGVILRMHLPDLALVARLSGHVSSVNALAVSKDGGTLYSGGYDRDLRVWDLGTNALVTAQKVHPQAINALELSPDGTRLATGCDDRIARIFSLSDLGAAPLELSGHYKPVTSVAWSPDGARLLTGSRDETTRLWDASSGAELARGGEMAGAVSSVVYASDGAAFASGESWVKVPIPVRYLKWLGRIVTFDFDRSFVDERPVMEKIGRALPVTLTLNIIAVLIVYLFSIPLGVLSAVKRGSTFDHVTSTIVFALYSMPSFWLATLLIMFLSSKQNLDILPSVGLISDNADDLSFLQWLRDGVLHLVLPITILVYGGFANISRYVRTSLLETIQEDYVRTARAKGLDAWTVIIKHAFRNSLITIVTLVGNLLPTMFGGSVIAENIFTIHGMGKLSFDAILARDYPVIMAITTLSALLTLLGILVSDLLYGVVDPRVRVE